MSGFPNRPDLASFGPDFIDTRPIRDPEREVGASVLNLMKFQVAGLGVVATRAYVAFTAVNPPVLLARAEVWNPRGLTTAPFQDPTITRIATGNFEVVWNSPVTDKDGNSVAISLSHGFGTELTPSSTTLRHVKVTPLSGNAAGVKVACFDSAGVLTAITSGVAIYVG
jgi:hypothetical protein